MFILPRSTLLYGASSPLELSDAAHAVELGLAIEAEKIEPGTCL